MMLPAKKASTYEELRAAHLEQGGLIEWLQSFADKVRSAAENGTRPTHIVLNAGVLKYPNRATEMYVLGLGKGEVEREKTNVAVHRSYSDFALHLHTNTIGPVVCAQRLIKAVPDSLSKVIFISSDSGSTALFRSHEDGFGAYAASKAALNQMTRHMAAELVRAGSKICILAIHPGEVQT